jgi:hypothetical protein
LKAEKTKKTFSEIADRRTFRMHTDCFEKNLS